MNNVPSFVWVIVAVVVALILFFWLLPMVFGGNSNDVGAILASVSLRR